MKQPRVLIILILGTSCLLTGYRNPPASRTISKLEKRSERHRSVLTKNAALLGISDKERITSLEEIGKIENGFSSDDDNYFENITSVCLDANNNLYVADSGVHKIFKFNDRGKFLFSFGKLGQDKAEFLGTMRISIGNDGKLNITDDGNWRLSIYDLEGHFIQQFPIDKYIYDIALTKSNGDIYLISPSGISLIDYYDKEMHLKGSLVEYSSHLDFPYEVPPKKMLKLMSRPSIIDLKKLMTKKDELILVSNNSLFIFLIDNDHRIKNKFRIAHPRLIENYIKRLKEFESKGA